MLWSGWPGQPVHELAGSGGRGAIESLAGWPGRPSGILHSTTEQSCAGWSAGWPVGQPVGGGDGGVCEFSAGLARTGRLIAQAPGPLDAGVPAVAAAPIRGGNI